MFCMAGIGYAGMPPVHSLRARLQLNIHGQRIYRGLKESYALTNGSGAGRVRAAILVLARNQDCNSVLLSMHRMERRFNSKFQYPYIFLNNAPFEVAFQKRTSAATSAETLYGVVPQAHWSYPAWVNESSAADARTAMRRAGVLHGGSESYHHMCRYLSGFFHHHPLLQHFDYFWRMEPDVHYYCDLDYDPFLYMQERSIKYGFTIAAVELLNTIPTLWNATLSFMAEARHLVAEDNLLSFVTGQHGDYLDRQGGFFWERWGDAPVHTLAAAMFLSKSEVHHFQDIGYRHNSMKHCPSYNRNNCACDALEAVEFHRPSYGRCHAQWEQSISGQAQQT
ncbi:hypothetical protein CVIRNUC_008288 [Coccomyxa viridis]|uniref:Uncharacterized protein n=1 Tax=Coccomyxa viridis TaxID=1274662 RepID=A0AAV1IFV6_9CHLO|nr:hypothetical protein CVIRNUC_008288 [Coccomyxa viridis]